MQPSPSKQAQNVEQIEQSLKLTDAELELWQQKANTFQEFAKRERSFFQELGRAGGVLAVTLDMFLRTHKARTDAEHQLMELQIAKLKSQAAVYRAVLEQAKQIVEPPGGKRLIS